MALDVYAQPATTAELPIGIEQLKKAQRTLQAYKQGKSVIEQRIIENQEWYRVRHWDCLKRAESQIQPSSAWLFNALANKHADMMDNFPAPNVLPREEGDKDEADTLTSIIPVILDQDNFEETYDMAGWYKLIAGSVCYGIMWDKTKLNGLGDVSVKVIDLLNLFWEPGITDLQKSRNLFHIELRDNDELIESYPELEGKLGSNNGVVNKFRADENVNTSDKTAVIDWYYKKKNANGKNVLHFVKFVNDVVLVSTENTPETVDKGLYDDGEYPFVIDTLFPIMGSLTGFGYIDIAKSPQEYIDRLGAAIEKNALANATPRYFVRKDGAVNENEFSDWTKPFVHFGGSLNDSSISPIAFNTLSDSFLNVQSMKIDELKEVTGNRDISTGGTTSGVTAASAIAAMQEAGGKLSRDDNKSNYRAFRQIVIKIIERIRQFYTLPRYFRILGEQGAAKFIRYSNQHLVAQQQGIEFGVELGARVPMFDVSVSAQKQSPYSKMAQNELALQFYGAGFFNPQMTDQALACLDMMDFDRKDFVMQKIAQNGGMYQQMLMMQQQMLALAQALDEAKGTNIAEQIAASINGTPAPAFAEGGVEPNAEALGGEMSSGESSTTKKARQRTAESTSPV